MLQTDKDLKYLIANKTTIKQALKKLNLLDRNLTLFVIDESNVIIGTVTDGDIRRGLIGSANLDSTVESIMNRKFRFIHSENYSIEKLDEIRLAGIHLIPLLDKNFKLVKLLDLTEKKSYLPIDVIIMAGGEGKRLRPLTDKLPKPLLCVGDKPIIEHNIDRFVNYGFENLFISINYLGKLISDKFADGSDKGITIKYIHEEKPMGTIGSISLIESFEKDYILIMNSDLLTNIDFEDLYKEFRNQGADMAIASVPYKVSIPYAVMQINDNKINAIHEKPTYTYYSNAGIYLIKKEIHKLVPKDEFFNATDLIELLISQEKKIISYPLLGYWLDIGMHEDFIKAQEDIKHIEL